MSPAKTIFVPDKEKHFDCIIDNNQKGHNTEHPKRHVKLNVMPNNLERHPTDANVDERVHQDQPNQCATMTCMFDGSERVLNLGHCFSFLRTLMHRLVNL